MVKNELTVAVDFYYKGEHFNFSMQFDADVWLAKQQGNIEALYDTLAAQNGLDRYRHEYDVMVMESLQFTSPTGLLADYVHEGEFDVDGFKLASEQQYILATLQAIARKHLDIDGLAEHTGLQNALLEAYRCGSRG